MDKDTSNRLWHQAVQSVADNQGKLDLCPRPHTFTVPVDRHTKDVIPAARVFCKWQCIKCGGIVEANEKHFYELGQKHGA